MLNDLVEINRQLAAPKWGVDSQLLAYLDMVPVCIAKLAPSVCDLKGLLARNAAMGPSGGLRPAMVDSKLDQDYLRYLRLASKDVCAGAFERLIETGLTLADAMFFAAISNDDIRTIAHVKRSCVYTVRREAVEIGHMLPLSASRQHALTAAAWG